MTEPLKGLAAITPERRVEMQKKAQETRKLGAEARQKMKDSGVIWKTPIKAIRAKCLDCAGFQYAEVIKCTVPKCPLFPYRFGKRPRDLQDITGEIPIEHDEPIDETDEDDIDEEIEVEE